MEYSKQARFLVPPFFLVASVFLGVYFDSSRADVLSGILNPDSAKNLLGLIVVVLPLGFFVGILSKTMLRILFWTTMHAHYEVIVSEKCLQDIWKRTNADGRYAPDLSYYAAETFRYEVLSKPIQEWIGWRWNAFSIAVNSCVAILIGHIVGVFLHIRQESAWWLTTIILLVFLVTDAVIAWREAMKMIEFQTKRTIPGPSPNGTPAPPVARKSRTVRTRRKKQT